MRSATLRWGKRKLRKQKKIPPKIQILFFRRLSHILTKGYPLLESLSITSWDPKLEPIASQITHHLKQGETLDEAFEKATFSSFVVSFLFFGRHHSDLSSTFQRCEDILTLQVTYKQKLFQALRYPLLLFVFILLAFSIIQKSILPNFLLLFEDEKTLWLMRSVSILINLIGVFGCLSVLLSCLWFFISPKLRLSTYLNLINKLNVVRNGYSIILSFLFSSHMHTLLATGLSLKESLNMIAKQKHQRVLSYYGDNILRELQEGQTLAQALHPSSMFREELTTIFHHTNDVKALQGELELLESFYMDYMETTLARWVQRIQPTIFILIAILVVTIYASIMLPLYQWMNQM